MQLKLDQVCLNFFRIITGVDRCLDRVVALEERPQAGDAKDLLHE
jgi:hypothetical protein